MKKIQSILFLHSFGKTIPESDLVSQQRFRLFRITTLFALLVFTGSLCQASLAVTGHLLFTGVISILFIAVFINYFALAFHKKSRTAFFILVFLAFTVLHVISYGQGGIRNSGIFYSAAIILIAYMLLGKAGGKIMAGISIVHVIYFYFVSIYTHWTDYSLIGTDPHLIDLDFLITCTLSILVLTAQVNYIEKSKNAIINDINSKKNELAVKNDELLNSQKALKQKNKEYEEKNKELEQFAFVASHDLQEPLRTTSAFVELFQQQYKGKLDEKAGKYLFFIVQASNRMRVLITDLLDYSKIGIKKKLKHVDCNIILNEVLADLDATISETGTEISAASLPFISGYETEIKQLFQNLIFNSIKFRKKNVPPLITICAVKNSDDIWQFVFSDNGIGIAKEHHERIFIIFQRLHTRNQYAGSGIGLSHCKKIVELHKGKIWLESELGKGTTFYFTIPQINNN
jgi:signal transduction histidine kinase